ncbi:MAG: four helix bundle protein [Patescibacteria group bacterium]
MENKNSFEKLDAWKEAHKLVIAIYKVTKKFPNEEKFRLIDQICRSVSSVAANIVEGNSRQYRKEFLQFLYLSKGSLEETKYHLLLARDLTYITSKEYGNFIDQCNLVGRLIAGLVKYLRS